MPPLTVSNWTNGSANLSDLRGKVVVVDFWGTWCGPCMNTIPHNVEMVRNHERDGLVFLGVSTSRGWDQVPQTIKQKRINYPIAEDVEGRSAKAWNVSFFPTYAVIDRKGTLRAIGLLSTSVGRVVEKLLAEPADAQPKDDPQSPEVVNSTPEIPEDWLEGSAGSRKKFEELMAREAPPAVDSSDWLNGPPQQVADLKGKVVLIQFWSPTRQACLRLLPELEKMHDSYGEHGLVVIGVSMAVDRDRVLRVVEEQQLSFPIAFDDDDQRIMKSYEANGLPDTFLIDRSGKLRAADIREDKIKDAVRKLLAEPDPAAAGESSQGG